MGKKILSIAVIALAAYGAWEGVKVIKAMAQKRKAAAIKPVVPAAPAK